MGERRTNWTSIPPGMRSLDGYSPHSIFLTCNMEKPIEHLKALMGESLPRCSVTVDAPDGAEGSWWLDVSMGRKHFTLEYRPTKGFGLFRKDAGYGEGPVEIYRSPERTAKRLGQLMTATNSKSSQLNLKNIRELYGQSQVMLARKVGVKQSAISRFEGRAEVKLSTLASAIKALGGRLEVRARFSDADVPVCLSTSK